MSLNSQLKVEYFAVQNYWEIGAFPMGSIVQCPCSRSHAPCSIGGLRHRGGGVPLSLHPHHLHNEFQLIRDNDPAAAIALGLSLLGFTLPVVSAIAHAANVVGPWIQFYFWLNQGPNCYRNLRNL